MGVTSFPDYPTSSMVSMMKWSRRELEQFTDNDKKVFDSWTSFLVDAGITVKYHGFVGGYAIRKIRRTFTHPKSTAHHYFTFWWLEVKSELAGVSVTVRRAVVPKKVWFRYINGVQLEDKERRCLKQIPMQLIDGDAYAVTKISANWGNRPVRISYPREGAAMIYFCCTEKLAKRSPDLDTYIRVEGNPLTAIPAFVRNSKRAKNPSCGSKEDRRLT